MQLTVHADYSLRVLLYLAIVPEGATIGEIAERYGISKNHLVKVAHQLGKLGYVDATRGRSGGLRIAKAPADICVGEVLRKVEVNFTLLECFDEATNTCPISSACGLKSAVFEAREAFFDVLDRYTIADVSADRGALLSLLGH